MKRFLKSTLTKTDVDSPSGTETCILSRNGEERSQINLEYRIIGLSISPGIWKIDTFWLFLILIFILFGIKWYYFSTELKWMNMQKYFVFVSQMILGMIKFSDLSFLCGQFPTIL